MAVHLWLWCGFGAVTANPDFSTMKDILPLVDLQIKPVPKAACDTVMLFCGVEADGGHVHSIRIQGAP